MVSVVMMVAINVDAMVKMVVVTMMVVMRFVIIIDAPWR